MITGGDLRQSRLDVGYKTFTISPWDDTGERSLIIPLFHGLHELVLKPPGGVVGNAKLTG